MKSADSSFSKSIGAIITPWILHCINIPQWAKINAYLRVYYSTNLNAYWIVIGHKSFHLIAGFHRLERSSYFSSPLSSVARLCGFHCPCQCPPDFPVLCMLSLHVATSPAWYCPSISSMPLLLVAYLLTVLLLCKKGPCRQIPEKVDFVQIWLVSWCPFVKVRGWCLLYKPVC